TKASTDSKEYVFVGWKVSGGTTVYADPNDYTLTADTIFEAQFEEKTLTYNISYNLNSGYFTDDANVTSSYSYGTSVTLPKANEGSGTQLLDFTTYNGTLNAGSYYTQTGTSAAMVAGKTYKLSFNYQLTNYSGSLGCGIGCGPKGSYTRDITYNQLYSGASGKFSYTFTPTAEQLSGREYLAIRFVRGDSASNYGTLSTTNIKFEEVQEIVRKGYVFGGWYTSADFSGSAVTQITATTKGDKVFYAKWVADTKTLTIKTDGGVLNGQTGTLHVTRETGSTFTLQNPTKANYFFSGWKTSDDNTIDYLQAGYTTIKDGTIDSASKKLSVYNNSGNGTVTITTNADSTSSTGYSMKIVTNGEASPCAGGFCNSYKPSGNKRYLVEVVAKIPTGYYLGHGSNLWNSTQEFITSTSGTGDWKTYKMIIATPKNIRTWNSSDFGYFYVNGTNNTSVTWYVNKHMVYELNSFSSLNFDLEQNNTLTALWIIETSLITLNSQDGTIKSPTYSGSRYNFINAQKATNIVPYMATSVNVPKTDSSNSANSTITRDGYTFDGWWTGEGGTGSKIVSATGTLQLVSGWTIKSGSTIYWGRTDN
ncbi:MAG: InlB B-repeat-containing protein, partial [Christensenellales bacterium]